LWRSCPSSPLLYWGERWTERMWSPKRSDAVRRLAGGDTP